MKNNKKFKRGDYVVRVDGKKFKDGSGMCYVYSIADRNSVLVAELNGVFKNVEIRHATKAEKYWMHTLDGKGLDRKFVGDFRFGDVYFSGNDVYLVGSDISIERARDWLGQGHSTGIYPAESFKLFPQDE